MADLFRRCAVQCQLIEILVLRDYSISFQQSQGSFDDLRLFPNPPFGNSFGAIFGLRMVAQILQDSDGRTLYAMIVLDLFQEGGMTLVVLSTGIGESSIPTKDLPTLACLSKPCATPIMAADKQLSFWNCYETRLDKIFMRWHDEAHAPHIGRRLKMQADCLAHLIV